MVEAEPRSTQGGNIGAGPVTTFRLPLRIRLRRLWNRLTGKAIPFRDVWE